MARRTTDGNTITSHLEDRADGLPNVPQIRKPLRSPLLLFILGGILIFLLDLTFGRDDKQAFRIDVTPTEVQRIVELWQVQMGSPPTPQQLDGLIEDWIRKEIYYREAMRLRLDEGDTIIRRRLVQKLEFITEDTAENEIPDYSSKLSYFKTHPEKYRIPANYTFSHIYFSDGAEAPPDRIDRAMEALSMGTNWRELGDAFMLSPSYAERNVKEIISLFGAEFAGKTIRLPLNEWTGPIGCQPRRGD